MARCGCSSEGCSCVITGQGGIKVTGAGTPDSPYVVQPQQTTGATVTSVNGQTGVVTISPSGIGAADATESFVLYSAQSLTSGQQAQARTNIGAAATGGGGGGSVTAFVTPEQYGAAADGTTDDSTAMQAAIDAVAAAVNPTPGTHGGIVMLTSGATYKAQFTLKMGVTLMALTRHCPYRDPSKDATSGYISSSFGARIIPPSGATGWHVTTPTSPADTGDGTYGCALSGIMFENTTGATCQGVNLTKTTYARVENCAFQAYRGSALRIDNSIGPSVSNVYCQSSDGGTPYTVNTGAFHVDTVDGGGFASVLASASDSTTIHNSATFYRSAIALTGTVTNCNFDGCSGTLADVGFNLAATSIANCTFDKCRATVNAGHGFYIGSATSNNTFLACKTDGNSAATATTYDSYNILTGALNNIFTQCWANDTATRGGFNDRTLLSAPAIRTFNFYENCRAPSLANTGFSHAAAACASWSPASQYIEGYGSASLRPCSLGLRGKVWFSTDLEGSALPPGPSTAAPALLSTSDCGWITFVSIEGVNDIVGNLISYAPSQGVSGWTGTSGTVTANDTSDTPIRFPTALKLVPTATSGVKLTQSTSVGGVVAGDSYSAAISIKSNVARSVTLGIIWKNSGGTTISTTTGTSKNTATAWDNANGTTDTIFVSGNAPTGATQATLVVTFGTTATSDIHRFTKAMLCDDPNSALTKYVEP